MHTTEPERGQPVIERIHTPHPEAPLQRRRDRYRALASLLGDDSPIVRDEVRRQYEASGREGLPSLMRATTAESPIVRGRARTLLLDREKTLAMRRLLRHVYGKKIDLEKALFLLGRYHDPKLDPRPAQARLDALAREVWSRTRGIEDPLDRAQVMVDYLATEVGFGSAKGDSQNEVYGIGMAFHINQMYTVRAEYQQIDDLGQDNRTGTEDLTVMGLGLIVRF